MTRWLVWLLIVPALALVVLVAGGLLAALLPRDEAAIVKRPGVLKGPGGDS